MKKKIVSTIICFLLVILAIIGITVYAETNGTEEVTAKKIANEESLVRMTAQLSRGTSTSSKVEVSTLSSELNKYAGNGATTVSEKSSTSLLVTFAGTGNEYEIDINSGALVTIPELPSTEYSVPYLPEGFTPVAGTNLDNGLTIQDSKGNQYVWVEVPRSNEVYPTAGVNITGFSSTDYTNIETDLHTYTSTYRSGISYKDEFYSTDQHGFANADDYNALKYKMLKSVYQNGGFYVGKYETGIADTEPDVIDTTVEARTSSSQSIDDYTPVIQANAYPYNYVTNKQAQELASTKFNGGGYTTSLMFGVQWDLVLKHLEVTNAVTTAELKSDSTEWGNYSNNTTYSTNANGKYYVSAWTDGAYNKTASGSVLLSTGASTEFERGGIYDLAGNVYEWTLEYTSITSIPCACRGGICSSYGTNRPASYRDNNSTTYAYRSNGFRVALY